MVKCKDCRWCNTEQGNRTYGDCESPTPFWAINMIEESFGNLEEEDREVGLDLDRDCACFEKSEEKADG